MFVTIEKVDPWARQNQVAAANRLRGSGVCFTGKIQKIGYISESSTDYVATTFGRTTRVQTVARKEQFPAVVMSGVTGEGRLLCVLKPGWDHDLNPFREGGRMAGCGDFDEFIEHEGELVPVVTACRVSRAAER